MYISSILKKTYQKQFLYDQNSSLFTLSTLDQFGITSNYNEKDVQLEITIPPKIKKTTIIKLNSKNQRDLNGSVLPHDYSGGINFYLNQTYSKSSSSNQVSRQNLMGSSDVFLNMNDYILEGRVSFLEGNTNPFVRNELRLVKDDRENDLRYIIGDIFLPTHQRITANDSFGISIEKIFNINGGNYTDNVSRVNSYEFFLKNRSLVEIYVNNKYKQALRLPPGTHNLYDLKLPVGINQVKLKVIEDNGKIEFIDFTDFSYAEVLRKGIMRYGVGVGINSKRDINSSEIIYNKDEKIVSAYFDYGVTDWLTVETGIQQYDDEYQALALEFLIGTPLGLINPYIVKGKYKDKSGYKKGINYRTDIDKANLNLGYEKVDSDYQVFSDYDILNSGLELYYANVYMLFPYETGATLSASKYTRYEGFEDSEKTYSIALTKDISSKLNVQFNYSEIDRSNSEDNREIYLSLNYRWGQQTQLDYVHYIEEQREHLNVRYDSSGHYGLSSELTYEHSNAIDLYNLRAIMNDEKFLLDSSYLVSKTDGHIEQSVGVQLATGVVFAGDKTTITSPITSSFVIVDNNDDLNSSLGIEGYQENDSYIYDKYALPLGDYATQILTVDEATLDFGIDLKRVKDKFITNYKSGSTMDIQISNFLNIKGVFFDKKTKKPLTHKAFKVFNTQTGEKEMGFTNKKGEFIIRGMGEGHYNISFVQEMQYIGIAKFNFVISNNDIRKRIIDFKNIYIQMPKKRKMKEDKSTISNISI